MQVTKGTWCMREQCVPGSLSSSPAQEPGNEANAYDILHFWNTRNIGNWQWVSREFEELLHWNGINHKTSDTYHPASNGLEEQVMQIFKKGIRKMRAGTLQDKIARFLFWYQNTPQSNTQ